MAAFNFPNSPSTNDLHTENSVTWKWNGTVWKRINNSYLTASTLDITGISTFRDNVTIVKTAGPLLELTTNTGAADATLRLSEGATGSTTNGGGMFYSGADNKLHITCGTNSTTKRITIDRDTGRVGVGTFTPHSSYRFDIRHTSDSIIHLGQNNNTLAGMGNDSWNAVSFQGTNCELGLYKDTSGNFSYIMGTYQGSTAIPLVFRTGNRAERLRISSTGMVGINTTAPTAYLSFNAQRSTQTMPPICFQTAYGSGLADAAISTTDDSGGTDIMIGSNVYMGQNGAFVRYYNAYGSAAVRCQYTGKTLFYNKSGNNAPVESMRIDGSGRVLIGTTTEGAVQAGNVTVSGTGDVGVTLRSTNSGTNRIFFSDATSGTGEYAGYINYIHSDNTMLFGTSEGTRVRIDSSGHALFSGVTTNNDTRNTSGITVKSSSGISFLNYGANGSRNWRIRPDDLSAWGSLEFSVSPTDNSTTDWPDAASDVVLELKKNKDVKIHDGNLIIGTSGHGISFAATSDASGMTSELMDDYEEGTWTPILYAWGGSQNQGYDNQTGNYIKIGNQVIANFNIDLNSKGTVSGNYVFIGGLPYNHAGNLAGTMVAWGWAMGSNIGWIAGDISSTNTVCWVTYHDNSNNNTGYLPSGFLYDNSQIKGTLIYRSA